MVHKCVIPGMAFTLVGSRKYADFVQCDIGMFGGYKNALEWAIAQSFATSGTFFRVKLKIFDEKWWRKFFLTIWGVPNWPPGEKSKWCHKFGDGVESGGGVGTLRWAPEVPQCLVCRPMGGCQGSKWPKMEKWSFFFKNPKFIDFFCLQCHPWASWTQETQKYEMGSQVMRGRS